MNAPQNVYQAQYVITDLVVGVTPTGAEAGEFIQNGQSVQLSLAQIVAALVTPIILPAVTAPTIRLPVFAATIPILTSDIEVGVSTVTSAVAVNLPSALAWSKAFPGGATGLDLVIIDVTGNAGAHTITPALNGGDTFLQGVTPVVAVNFGSLRLRPAGSPVSGWYVKGLG